MHETILSDLIITNIYSVVSCFSAAGLKGRRTSRERWALMYKYTGETAYTSNGQTYLCDALHPVLIPKGCTYEWVSLVGGVFEFVEFDSPLEYGEPLPITLSDSDYFHTTMQALLSRWRHEAPFRKQACIRDLYIFLLKLLKSDLRGYRPTTQQLKIQRAVDYMIDHYNENIRNDDLAFMVGMSTVYFRKVFSEVYGMPPIAYIHSLRIKRAKEMLKSDFGSITSVAQSLGYASIYDFSRAFKNHTGLSPSGYLKENQRKLEQNRPYDGR